MDEEIIFLENRIQRLEFVIRMLLGVMALGVGLASMQKLILVTRFERIWAEIAESDRIPVFAGLVFEYHILILLLVIILSMAGMIAAYIVPRTAGVIGWFLSFFILGGLCWLVERAFQSPMQLLFRVTTGY